MKLSEKIILEDVKNIYDSVDLTELRGKNVLIAGASGLIGAYFTYLFYYLNEFHSFDLSADLIVKDKISKKSHIYNVKDAKNFVVIQKDLSKPAAYTKKYDYVMYTAGFATPSVFVRDPFGTMDVNYMGMKNILESLVTVNPTAKILYLSSGEIYGSPPSEYIPTPETYPGNSPTTHNRACYIESKRLTEVLCLAYNSQHNMRIKIVRPVLLYGPGITFEDQRVMGHFMKKAHENKRIDMIDDGSDLRCFCYIADGIKQFLHILLFGKDTIYNVGSSKEEVSIKELALLIGEIFSADVVPGVQKTAEVMGAPSRVCLDLQKVKTEFGLEPRISIREGLRKTVDWNKTVLEEQGNC